MSRNSMRKGETSRLQTAIRLHVTQEPVRQKVTAAYQGAAKPTVNNLLCLVGIT